MAFAAVDDSNKTISTTTTSARVALSTMGDVCLVSVTGSSAVFVKLGDASVTASDNDIPVRANSTVMLSRGAGDTYLAAIAVSGTPTVYVMNGYGDTVDTSSTAAILTGYSPRPKIIQFGQVVTTTYMAANIATMESNAAFDGFVFHVDYTDPFLGNQHLCDRAFCTYPVDWALLETQLTAVRRTKFGRFTDMYIRLNGLLPGTVDWFDTQGMKNVEHNWGITAKFAKESGCKGIWLDCETTGGGEVFKFTDQQHYLTKTFAEYKARIRQYGSILMNAIQAHFPDIDLNLTFGYEQANHQADGTDEVLSADRYGLYPTFLDGIYDAARGNTTITNMMELAYGWQLDVDFDYGLAKQQNPPNCDSDNYHNVHRVGFSTWIDYESDGDHPWDNVTHATNYNTPAIHETILGKALSRCGLNGKVEVYNQIPRYWNVTSADMPQAYRDALLSARTTAGIEVAFSPGVIKGVKCWLNPATLSALANDDPVSSWTDSVGGYVASNTGTNRPTYKTAGFGAGLPAVLFASASSQYLDIHALAALFTGTVDRDLTIIIAFQQTSNSPGAFGYWLGFGKASGAAAPERSWGISSTPRITAKKVNDAASSSTFSSSGTFNSPNMATIPHVITIREVTNTLEFRLDGARFARTFTVSTTGTTMTGTGFTANVAAGNVVRNAGGDEVTVVSVDSNTSITLSAAFSPDLSDALVSTIQGVTTFTKASVGTLDQARIGASAMQTAATFNNGLMGDIVIANNDLEDTDLIRIERYIGARCGATVA